jgi:uncharacterized protein
MSEDRLALTRRQMMALLSVAAATKACPTLAHADGVSPPENAAGAALPNTGAPLESQRLADVEPELDRLLKEDAWPRPLFSPSDIQCRTVQVPMRDGVRLATDLYLPPKLPAAVIVMRTPYGRDLEMRGQAAAMLGLARRGYVVVSQDCRGTGASEPDHWDYFVYETEDGYDCVEWITQQEWYGGFIGSFGGSYIGQTQWPMAMHPRMSAIIPSNCSLGIAVNTVRLYMFLNAFAHVVGKGEKLAIPVTEMERHFEKQTMAAGYFNEPLHQSFSDALLKRFPNLRAMPSGKAQRWLWEQYCAMTSAQRAAFIKQALDIETIDSVEFEKLPLLFGQQISIAAITIPYVDPPEPCRRLHAPPLIRTGWYDWHVHETLATWETLRREGRPEVAERARLIISHAAHNMPGYQVGGDEHPELLRLPSSLDQVGLMTRWYKAVEQGKTDRWPRVIYYLMGANEWRVASDWPVPEAKQIAFYLSGNQSLTSEPPRRSSRPDRYTYDPTDPTPTVGGSIVSFLYRPGSLDVSKVQKRSDVLTYTSAILKQDLDVVGPLRMILYASSSALDTDFAVRLSDVFPDGRAIALQNGMLRARYRNIAEPEWLEPGRVYRFEIDMWATANRFKAGHRLRIDVSSADFPHYDRNSNRGGDPGEPIAAKQAIYHDAEHPSHLIVSVLNS